MRKGGPTPRPAARAIQASSEGGGHEEHAGGRAASPLAFPSEARPRLIESWGAYLWCERGDSNPHRANSARSDVMWCFLGEVEGKCPMERVPRFLSERFVGRDTSSRKVGGFICTESAPWRAALLGGHAGSKPLPTTRPNEARISRVWSFLRHRRRPRGGVAGFEVVRPVRYTC